eukprot:3730994-Rhodomonas_salina.1
MEAADYMLWLCCMLWGLLVERVVHAVCVLIWHVVSGTPSDFKTSGAFAVLSSSVLGGWNLILGAGVVATTTVGGVLRVGRWIVQVTVLGLLLTFVLEYYPALVEDAILFYNNGFGLGLRAVVFEPAKLLYLVASVLLPVYNVVVYIGVKLLSVVLLPGLQFDFSSLLKFLNAFRDLVVHIIASLSAYLVTFKG